MTVLLTGAGCVEAATTANTVFKTETEGVLCCSGAKLPLEDGQISL